MSPLRPAFWDAEGNATADAGLIVMLVSIAAILAIVVSALVNL